MKPLVIDGSRDDDKVWYALGHNEQRWREIAGRSKRMVEMCVRPEARAVMDESTHNHVYGYLEPEHLVPPWTPALLLAISDAGRIPDRYAHGRDTGEVRLDAARDAFAAAGLTEWVEWVEGLRAQFRRRVGWLDAGDIRERWKPFQVDINSPSLFLDVTGPDVWQVIVDAFVDDGSRDWQNFLRDMRMASLEYVLDEIPGPHADPNRKHEPGMPFGYGTSLTMPSFGYRREHRSDILFSGWAVAAMPGIDLFDEKVWAP